MKELEVVMDSRLEKAMGAVERFSVRDRIMELLACDFAEDEKKKK